MDYQAGKASFWKVTFPIACLVVSQFLALEPLSAVTVTDSHAVSVTALVKDPNATTTDGDATSSTSTPPFSGGGGGSSPYSQPFTPVATTNTIVINGVFAPGITISALSSGNLLSSTSVADNGVFTLRLPNLKTGVYSFLLTATDPLYKDKQYQSTLAYTVYVSDYAETYISDVVFPPLFSPVKTSFKSGSSLEFSGKAYPGSRVSVLLDSKYLGFESVSQSGVFVHKSQASQKIGKHTLVFKYEGNFSSLPASKPQTVTIFGQSIKDGRVETVCGSKADFSQDCRVSIVDFSILAYWYKRSNFPPKYDLNSDGKIDIKDFSIMAYYWTG